MLVILLILPIVSCEVLFDDKMKSFAYANKQGRCVEGKELLLYEHKTGPGVITEQWYTGADCFNQGAIVRYYIDDEETPSIEGNLYMMHGTGVFENITYPQYGPWGAKWMGHLAQDGGLYNTFRIPYQTSFRVTLISTNGTGWLWYIIRGVENYPVVIGDLKLPSNAKLVLQKIDNVMLPPYSYVTVAHSNKTGLVFMAALAAVSRDFEYLEGCFRLLIDNNTHIQYLSSGTEDFFLSAYYFNDGVFRTEHSGLTVRKDPGTMSAYKYFVSDPILFQSSMYMIWRVGEKTDNNCYNGSPERCIRHGSSVRCIPAPGENDFLRNVQLMDTQISAYVWFYEW